ncbi:Ammonium transporter 1 member 3 [Monoraphidium neglectum]|uniref:Ammonium transporter n=1 Tax=Monoraphidium neglectum TaxID=145388 RepID=A0A0D2N6E7_9CHLO|nr:Ammonium transporter 1 member 3 [Monoraphidium neglectum]KIZ07862.1 Ammonium transporter 1 member 3 [Monoraphidium neglectum]|eukprot:XP_013906881.1 Ammonium transporter 1 member 3 [Monoraphidium neglectum]
MPAAATLACSPDDLSAVAKLVGAAAAADVCAAVDVAAAGSPLAAVLRHLTAASAAAKPAAAAAAAEQAHSTDVVFILFSGYLVFLMQPCCDPAHSSAALDLPLFAAPIHTSVGHVATRICVPNAMTKHQAGFACLCAGHVRVKNAGNILMKNVVDCSVGTLAWYLLGNGFAFGQSNGRANPFIGTGNFALNSVSFTGVDGEGYPQFFFHWAFSAAATTIVSGAVAERISFGTYMLYSCFMSSLVYPVVAHWLWTQWGWLSPLAAAPLFGSGAIDFAGGVVVHTVGGAASLIGVYFCGPRVGRFGIDGSPCRGYRENNSNLIVLGTFLLWFGWYGFNPGSALAVSTYSTAALVARTAVTTTIGAGTGGLSAMLIVYALTKKYDVMALCNGVLCGLVAVTPGCGVIDPWAAVIVAVLAAGTFIAVDHLMLKLRLDDVVSAVPMHLGCGALGTLCVGFFARQQYVEEVYGAPGPAVGRRWGVFFGGDGRLLACQVVALLSALCWVSALLVPYFWVARRLNVVRVPVEQEISGLDASKYGVLTTNELPTKPRTKRAGYV